MEYVIIYSNPPIPAPDILKIQNLLKKANIICTAREFKSFDKYSIYSYLKEKDIFNAPTRALVDRNIFTDIISLVNGKVIDSPSESIRLSAALMAFLQCSNILIEPSISLYEYASLNGSKSAKDELYQFRIADNIHPEVYTDIALNRKNIITEHDKAKVDIKKIEKPKNGVDYQRRLSHWNFNYTLVLKMAMFEVGPLQPKEKLANFIKWMSQEFYFGAVGVLFANIYFSNKRMRKMIKSIRSNDKKKALAGVKNITWDLTLLTQWSRYVKEQAPTNTLWLLCSRDKLIMKIAPMIMGPKDDLEIANIVRNLFRIYWGDTIGEEIYQLYSDCRKGNRNHSVDYLNNLMLNLEKEFLGWQGVP